MANKTFTPTTDLEKFVFGFGEKVADLAGQAAEYIKKDWQTFTKNNELVYKASRNLPMTEPERTQAKAVAAERKDFALNTAMGMTEPLKAVGNIAKPAVKVAVKQLESGFAKSVKESPKTAQAVKEGIKSFYTPITNKDTLAQANQIIKTNIDEAIKIAKSPEPASALSNAVSMRLVDTFQSAGRFQDAIDIVETTAKKATNQGQAIQALSMYSKLTPTGALKYTQRIIDTANAERKLGLKLTQKAAKEITEQANKVARTPEGRQKVVETAKLMQKMTGQVPSDIWQKISAIQTMSQLLNPKTAIRNVVGNVGFSAMENIKDVAATALDSALSVFTKKRTTALPSITAQLKGFKSGWVEGVEDALNRIDTSGISSQFDLPKAPVFKGGVGAGLEKTLNLELKASDRAFYRAAYDGSLAQQMKAARITDVAKITDAMKEQAHFDGLYRTFQDNNAASKIFSGIKKALNLGKGFGLGDLVLKYPKTPGALLARGIEYSPAGFINSTMEAAKPLIGKQFNQRRFVESFARAFTGSTTLIGAGALLHRLGIITGKPDSDADVRGLQKESGLGAYRINASALKRFVVGGFNPEAAKMQQGDTIISYDWFQPQAINLAMGANIDEGNGAKGAIMDLVGTMEEGVRTLGEQPLVSGMTKLFRSGDFATAAKETLKGVPSSFVPTILSQLNQLIDNTSRNTYDPDTWHYAWNLAKNKVPGLAQTLPPVVNVFGDNAERYQGDSNNIFNVFFAPAFASKVALTPEATMLLEIMNETGETKQLPRSVNRSVKINGENVKLTPNQITQYQRWVGTATKEIFSSMAQDDRFQSLPPEEKVNYLAGVLTDINGAAKIVVLGNRPKNPSKKTIAIVEMFEGRK